MQAPRERAKDIAGNWANGVGMRIAILVIFGLFEKRQDELKSLASKLKEWEF